MSTNSIEKATRWLADTFDSETRAQVQQLIDHNPEELEDAFYKELEFGTGGMRGIMGVGTNRLNKYTIGAATQGLANYIIKTAKGDRHSVAIAHDVRHNSDTFAQICADILSANGIEVYLFDGFRPTPELSFAVRHIGCTSGIVLTASHNPPEYNGYKVYWNDGAQVVPPHDNGIIDEVKNVNYAEISFDGRPELIHRIGEEIDSIFQEACVSHVGYSNKGKEDLNIVFTSIHGTSIAAIPDALKLAGFTNVHIVEEQAIPSGDFPTVASPNPEEKEALQMALNLADKVNADILIGTDPDADRLGIGVRDLNGDMILLNGNQTNTVLTDYLLEAWEKQGKLTGKEFIGSTIVTSDIMFEIAQKYGVQCKASLTGFKWLGKMIKDAEGSEKFICGGEESYGFMVDDFVRDKDSVTATLLACEIAADAKANGSSFYDRLLQIYVDTNCYQEGLTSLKKTGKSGAEEIKQIISDYRSNPPAEILGSPVIRFDDYQSSESINPQSGEKTALNLPKSNVLVFFTAEGTRVAVRPSGTEPKIKFYFSVKEALGSKQDHKEVQSRLMDKITQLEQLFVNA